MLSATLVLLGTVALAPAVQAAGSPNVGIAVDVPTEALQGSTFPVTLTATNPGAPAGYNASFRLVLPPGAVVASADPAVTTTVPQVDGSTVLIWSNVSDLLVATSSSVTANVSSGTLPLGALSFTGAAFVHSDPRTLPAFDALGAPVPASSTGSDTSTVATQLVPFTITKDIVAPENELVRGVHDHRTAVLLTIDNNLVGPSTAFDIVDYVPATLEFLGCGLTADDGDNSAAEEYPGSGPLNDGDFPTPGGSDGCAVATSVETLEVDPPGPQPSGVYTVVHWDNAALTAVGAGALATSGTRTIHYVVGVPQNANAVFSGAVPSPVGGTQGSNLDNNTGASTLETGEQEATNAVELSGSYDDPSAAGGAATYTDGGTDTVTLEDLAIRKSASQDGVVQGIVTTWTLIVDVSEYTGSATNLVVADTVPDGLLVTGTNPAATSVVVQPNGSTLVTWSGVEMPDMATNGTRTLEMTTQTLESYRETADPVRAKDAWTNTVSLTGQVDELVGGAAEPVRGVADVSAASQSAGPITLTKYVGAPLADGTCGDGAGLVWQDDVWGSEFGPGDHVCWRIDITAPVDLDTTSVLLTDFLPAGFEFVGAETGTGSAITFPATGTNPAVDGQAITWDLTGASDLDESTTARVVVRSRIVDPLVHEPVDVVENLAKLAYTNTPGAIFQLREQADAPWTEAVLDLTKTADAATVDGGDVLTYTISVPNTGDQDAVDVQVRDLLPAQISCSDLVGGSLTGGFTCDVGTDRIDGVIPSIAAGASGTVTYQVDVPSSVVSGTTLVNTAGVRTYETVTNDGGRFTYVPAGNIDPALTPNTTAADDDAIVTVRAVGLTKTRTTSVVEPGNRALDQATPGEVISYTVSMTLPAETTLTSGVLTDNVPASLTLDEASVTVSRNDSALAGSFVLSTTATQVRVTFPTPYTVGLTDEVITVLFDARVKDASGPSAGNTVTNTATLTATGMTSVPASVGTVIVEPRITTTKTETDADNLASPGELIGFTVTAGNSSTGGATSTAHDVVVVDTIPTSMTPVDAGGTVLTDGQQVPSGGVWNLALRTLTWDAVTTPALAAVAPASTVSLAYEVRVADPVPSPTSFTNTVATTTRSLDAGATGERGPGGVSPTRYTAGAAVTLQGPRSSLTKTVTPGTATIGDEVTYTIVATIPASVTTYDATVIDTLPAGMAYVATDSASCTAPLVCSIGSVTTLTPNVQQLGWFIGDLQDNVAVDREVTIVYRARVADVVAASNGAVVANTARVATNLTDQLGSPTAVADLGTFTDTSTPAIASVTVLEPHVTLLKTVAEGAAQVESRRVVPGETVTYSIVVANSGTSAAHDVLVDDATDSRFTAASVVDGAGWTVTDADPYDGTLAFTVAVVPAGGSVTITYQLTVPALDPVDEVPGFEILNTADATYTSLPGAVPGERAYDDVTPDTVTLEADVARLGDTVWFDIDGDGTQGPGEPGVAGVTVTVVYHGGDDTLGTPDDETHVATTAADGTYLVTDLPAGQYTVTADAGTLPAGMVVVDDLDGAPGGLGTATVALAGDEIRTDVDFGVRGTGALGDTVWLDLDADATLDTGEPGLVGIGVDVTLDGPDDLPGTADDVVIRTVTGPGGLWSVTGVPQGDVTVALDPTTFPAGLAPASDPDGGAADGVALGTLPAGATDLTFDFGLRGTARLGDRVWLDTDADGNQDAGEPGIPAAEVEVRWEGLDEALGTADDAVLLLTTGPDGLYDASFLPTGDFTVTVLSLPTALAPTYDEDGLTASPDGTTAVALALGAQHLTADFGYVAATGVGDRLWLDLDDDGAQDVGEPGLPGVEVTVTSAGVDGVLDTPDDIVRTTTTAANGQWLVTGLPAGLTRIEVTGTLPTGVVPTYDADGLGTPSVSELTLTDGVTDLDQDFGYVGPNAIGDRTWIDIDRDGVQDPGEHGLGGLTITVTFVGADGVEGGGDDLVVQTVTALDGSYVVSGLPDGDHLVEVVAGLPAGYAPSWDETGAADQASVVTGLGVGAGTPITHGTADFGFAGTGALGGTVWLDRDADGVLDRPSESGLPGIGVDVTWAGPDAVLGTPDDVVIRAVTAPGGVWIVEGMPPGPFTATVDPTTVPPGTTVVFDRESGLVAPDGSLSGALAPGERRLDVDTGLRGTSSIGNLVWVDANRNGTRDRGDPGASNMRVVATWHGADGVLGGPDDVALEVRTAADGSYVVDGLPAGRYTVTFDRSTLPLTTAPFADLDNGDSLVTTVDLAVGQVRTDVNVVLRLPAPLAATGTDVGMLALLAMLLVGTGVLVRRRAKAATA